MHVCKLFAQFCLHSFVSPLIMPPVRASLLYYLKHSPHSTHPCTLSPSVCIMFLALPLFLFAGRAKAEPARQTTTKRRKRKNSASSANSSVGTTASKKRSPATNFSLSSQVPVSISSTRFASSFYFFFLLWLHMHVCRVTHSHKVFLMVLQLLGLIYLHKREKNTAGGEARKEICAVRQRILEGFVWKHPAPKDKEKKHQIS